MDVHYKSQENMSDSVGLLISILVRYPEVATINFDPEQQVLKFTFILNRQLDEEEIKTVKDKVLDAIEVYNLLEDKDPKVVLIGQQECDQFTLIEIQRDVDTLVQEEIALIVNLFYDGFWDYLVTDQNGGSLIEEDLLIQEELIEHMLENVKCRANNDRYLYAIREEGRVLVFNK